LIFQKNDKNNVEQHG
jgi:hypothetical protein